MPRWALDVPLVYIGWTYTLSGVEKVLSSGLGWADGTSLQLWMAAFGRGPLASVLSATPWAASLGQAVVLALEILAVLGLGWSRSRPLFGLGLLLFHGSLELSMGLGFYGNEWILLVLCFPWQEREFGLPNPRSSVKPSAEG